MKCHNDGVECLLKATNIAHEEGDKDSEKRNKQNLANAFYNNEEYNNAVEWYGKALEMTRQLGDKVGERNSLESLVMVYNKTGNHDMAI